MMAIEMAGGVYCPLSPRDPQHRVHALVQQTESRLVLVHCLTKVEFINACICSNIDSILCNNVVATAITLDHLSDVIVTVHDTAYVIFTSGSTGTPKAVRRYFVWCQF